MINRYSSHVTRQSLHSGCYAHTAGKSALCNLCIQSTHASKPSSRGPAVCDACIVSVCLSALSLSSSPVTPVQPPERGRMRSSCPAPAVCGCPTAKCRLHLYICLYHSPPLPALPGMSVSVLRQLYCNCQMVWRIMRVGCRCSRNILQNTLNSVTGPPYTRVVP